MDEITMVTLRTGVAVPWPVEKLVEMHLRSLANDDVLALYDLVMLCRNGRYILSPGTAQTLHARGLIDTNGQPHDDIRAVVLASVEGEGLEMHLVDPLAE